MSISAFPAGRRLLAAATLGLALVGTCQAAIDTYEFDSEAERQRYRTLIEELRCPKCQNQNIADSNAPIAMDLRAEIYRMLEEGRSNDEIVEHLVLRYGDFVRYKPPLDGRTLLLWFGPGVLLLGGLVTLIVIVRRRLKVEASSPAARDLSPEERERLATLLDEKAP